MARRGRVAGALAAGAVAAGAAAAGAALERSARSRRSVRGLDPERGYGHTPDRTMTVVASDGVALHVEIDEPATEALPVESAASRGRPTVVMCHGFTLNCNAWVFQRRALSEAGYRVVTWDQRSHGRSGISDDEHVSMAQLGHDLHDVLAATAPEGDLVLIGHSMGGMTVMSFAGHHPEVIEERTLAVAFVATSAGGGGLTNLGMSPFIGTLLGRLGPGFLHRLDKITDIVTRVRRAGRPIEDAMVERYSFDSPVSQDLVRFAADMIFATRFDAMGDFVPAIETMDLRKNLTAFKGTEVIVINGVGDLLTPPSHSEAIVELVPGAEHVVVEDAGHLIMLEHPDLVTQQIRMAIERGEKARVEHVAIERKPRVRRKITDVARRRQVERAKENAG